MREKYELLPSFKSILLDSKLGTVFKRFSSSRIFQTNFVLKGHTDLKYEINKHANSYFSIKSRLKKYNFKTINQAGAYYAFNENTKHENLNYKTDKILTKLVSLKIIPYIFTMGRSVVLIAKNK